MGPIPFKPFFADLIYIPRLGFALLLVLKRKVEIRISYTILSLSGYILSVAPKKITKKKVALFMALSNLALLQTQVQVIASGAKQFVTWNSVFKLKRGVGNGTIFTTCASLMIVEPKQHQEHCFPFVIPSFS